MTLGPGLYAERTEVDGDGSGYWVGTQHSTELVRRDLTGQVTTIVRWPPGDRRVQPGDAARTLEERLATNVSGDPAAITRLHDALPVPELYPAYATLLVAGDGAVWVEEYRRPGHSGPLTWRVFAADGVLAGTIRIPSDLDVRDVGADYVLGVTSDELGVQYVQLYGVTRTPPP